MSGDRDLDVVVFGATGFVGRLVAGYLAGHAPGGVRIGLAGRSERRLADVRAQLGAAASAWPLLVADSADPVPVAKLARAARVVVSTVGPYRTHGLALVQACAAAGTDYADLTGEVLFIRDSIDRCHDVAVAAGARIVHCCGFDSVPSDLGVLLLHHAARADDAGDLQETTLVVVALRGGVSGGTLASMMGQQEETRASAERRRVAGDPYALSPDRAAEPDLGDERDLGWVKHDGELRIWTGPFAMAGINTRVVRRSNALQDWAYGRRFRYREVTGFGTGPAAPLLAATASGALKALDTGLAFAPSRTVLSRLLPAPGHGPGERTRRTGYFRIQIHTRTSAGVRYLATIEAQGDPGYAATSVMLGETALCLALDRDHLPDRAGVLTPATAMGAALATRLRSARFTLAARQVTRLRRGRRET
ncbi:MAG TPA: saccharopine dehydrogenase NADP-binding domain-containing protein [Streptosporangiaceae bacterium]|nr:saccharopine dehydrogenase NADP-binding domain-containing protein [Streptosporangiaceae bacterium]